MLTKLILKISLFATFITFVYCTVTNIGLVASAIRAGMVFAGFYALLTAFFIALRMLLQPHEDEEEPPALPEGEEEIEAEIEEAVNAGFPENIGAFGE